jgi:ApaG protein
MTFSAMAVLFPHEAVTGDVTVRVAVSFMAEQSAPASGRWFWSYHIRIENNGDANVQLLARSWTITDSRGAVHEVRGEGVVGQSPVIAPGAAYDYVSGCPLPTPTGRMTGSYQMIDAEGRSFEVAIPTFPLVGPI